MTVTVEVKKVDHREKHRPTTNRARDKVVDIDNSCYEDIESDECSDAGQEPWEKTGSPAPVPPPIKPKPERLTTKRRKDKAEEPTGTKTKIKRKYNPIRCMYCGEVGHNKRTCSKKKQDDAQEKARLMQLQLAVVPPP
ncbi:hypothetical protein Ahy_A03g011498 [Arachis hypogaea]|uniref:CCHC-type domain-containing protein n=1 Tax=Arachis hypogaea TaxID=3818 RepID=A0A445DQW2_ARAHY|nr:hypothetical protein Ahy_A03g011498 [Arachis hypogaea]